MLEIPITPEMSKAALVVVYYVRPDGEVVADGIELQVETCSKNDVRLHRYAAYPPHCLSVKM